MNPWQEQALQRLEDKMMVDGAPLVGWSTGLHGIDRYSGGWRQGEFAVVLGAPRSYKSSVLLLFARSAAFAGARVLLFGGQQTSDRLMALCGEVALTRVESGNLSVNDLKRIQVGMEILSDRVIVEGPPFTSAAVEDAVEDHDPDVVIVDDAHLLDDGRPWRLLSRTNDITVIAAVTVARDRRSRGVALDTWNRMATTVLDIQRIGEGEDVVPLGEAGLGLRVLSSGMRPPGASVTIVWDWNARPIVVEIDNLGESR